MSKTIKLVQRVSFVICFVAMMSFISSYRLPAKERRSDINFSMFVHEIPPAIVEKRPTKKVSKKYRGNLDDYLLAVASKESNLRPTIINKHGMMGKYQFSPRTLLDHGIHDFDNFLSDESLQDSVMVLNLKKNSRQLSRTIRRFSNRWFKVGSDSVYVTKSGILAGAHLVGVGGVLSSFYPDKYDHPIQDSNGTTIYRYMKLFGNYYLEGI